MKPLLAGSQGINLRKRSANLSDDGTKKWINLKASGALGVLSPAAKDQNPVVTGMAMGYFLACT